MGKGKKHSSAKKGRAKPAKRKAVSALGSDEEEDFQPKRGGRQPTDDELYLDDVDDFHANKDKIMLERAGVSDGDESAGDGGQSETELWAISDSDDSDGGEMASVSKRLKALKRQNFMKKLSTDSEEENDDVEIPDAKAWGLDQRKFYGAEIQSDRDLMRDKTATRKGKKKKGKKKGAPGDDEPSLAELEEIAARDVQARLQGQLQEDDFGLDLNAVASARREFSGDDVSAAPVRTAEVVERDLSRLSRKERLELLKKESPELLPLLDELQAKMDEINGVLRPIRDKIDEGTVPKGSPGGQYVETKLTLLLDYCLNVSFYLLLRSQQPPGSVQKHPVLDRIKKLQGSISELEKAQSRLEPDMREIVEFIRAGRPIRPLPDEKVSHQPSDGADEAEDDELQKDDVSSSGELSDAQNPGEAADGGSNSEAELEAALEQEIAQHGGQDDTSDEEAGGNGEEAVAEEDQKRPITYEISKNKGLTPYRKKANRNPRVKHREKFRRAKVRRKGQVREPRKELKPYAGELSGVRAGVVRSVPLK